MEIKMNHSDYANFRGFCHDLSYAKNRAQLHKQIIAAFADSDAWKKYVDTLPDWAADAWMLKRIRAAMAVSSLLLDLYKSGQLVLVDDADERFVKAEDAQATLGIPANLIDDAFEQGFKMLEATLDPADPQKCHIAAGACTLARGIALSKSPDPSPNPHL